MDTGGSYSQTDIYCVVGAGDDVDVGVGDGVRAGEVNSNNRLASVVNNDYRILSNSYVTPYNDTYRTIRYIF